MTVTVCGVLQLLGVNVRVATFGEPWPGFELFRPTVTFAVGLLVSWTWKVAVLPASVVKPEVGVTRMLATSVSWFVTVTGGVVSPLYESASRLLAEPLMV